MKLCQTILIAWSVSLFSTWTVTVRAADVDPLTETSQRKPAPAITPAPVKPAPIKPPAPADPTTPKSTPEIDKYVRQLGDADFRKRDEAVRELRRIGRPAVNALNEALKSSDPEV